MKTWIKTSIAVAVIAAHGFGANVALARGGDCEGNGPRGERGGWHQMSPERMKSAADLHLARLELALAIKPEQKRGWDTFKAAMLERADKRAAQMAARAKDELPKNAIERMERMETFGKAHLAELSETRRDVEALYATLSDAQKKVFDAEFRHGGPGMHGHRGMYGGMGQGMGPDGAPGRGPGPGRN